MQLYMLHNWLFLISTAIRCRSTVRQSDVQLLTGKKTNNGLTCLVGQSEVRGLQVYHKRLSPETINLDRGQLDFHVNVSPQAVELDSTSLVRFNALTFHPI